MKRPRPETKIEPTTAEAIKELVITAVQGAVDEVLCDETVIESINEVLQEEKPLQVYLDFDEGKITVYVAGDFVDHVDAHLNFATYAYEELATLSAMQKLDCEEQIVGIDKLVEMLVSERRTLTNALAKPDMPSPDHVEDAAS